MTRAKPRHRDALQRWSPPARNHATADRCDGALRHAFSSLVWASMPQGSPARAGRSIRGATWPGMVADTAYHHPAGSGRSAILPYPGVRHTPHHAGTDHLSQTSRKNCGRAWWCGRSSFRSAPRPARPSSWPSSAALRRYPRRSYMSLGRELSDTACGRSCPRNTGDHGGSPSCAFDGGPRSVHHRTVPPSHQGLRPTGWTGLDDARNVGRSSGRAGQGRQRPYDTSEELGRARSSDRDQARERASRPILHTANSAIDAVRAARHASCNIDAIPWRPPLRSRWLSIGGDATN
jgi:hypothetical protein